MYRLQIQIQDFKNLKNIQNKLIKLQKNLKIKDKIFIIIKKKKKIYTLLRSPHVNKKSREQFIFQKYKINYYICDLNLYKLLNFLVIIKHFKFCIVNTKLIKL